MQTHQGQMDMVMPLHSRPIQAQHENIHVEHVILSFYKIYRHGLLIFVDQCLQSTFVTYTHSFELPFSATAIQTPELNGCFNREILVQIIACYFFVGD